MTKNVSTGLLVTAGLMVLASSPTSRRSWKSIRNEIVWEWRHYQRAVESLMLDADMFLEIMLTRRRSQQSA